MAYEKETADAIAAGLIEREYPHEYTEKGRAFYNKPSYKTRAEAAEKRLAEVAQERNNLRHSFEVMKTSCDDVVKERVEVDRLLATAEQRIVELEKQLAEAQEHLDHARIAGIYDIFASIPDVVYQMARYIKDQKRQLTDAQARIAELEQLRCTELRCPSRMKRGGR